MLETACKILDTDSSNGVRINGLPRTEHFLQHGDTIELGNILVRFVAAGAWDPLLEQLQMQQASYGEASTLERIEQLGARVPLMPIKERAARSAGEVKNRKFCISIFMSI